MVTTNNSANDEELFVLSEEQYQMLEDERLLHLSGESKSYTIEEARYEMYR